MDPITHGLLGAATAQAAGTKKIGRKVWLIGALAAMAPDLDVIIQHKTNPLLLILYHRQFTHSLIFIPLGGFIVGLFCCLLSKQFRINWGFTIILAILAYATHSLLDACTSYGTQLLWPFSHARIAWDIIFIVDPIFTSILLIGVILAYRRVKARPAIIALLLAAIYLLFGVSQHQRALHLQKQIAESRKQIIIKERVMPALGNLFTFRSIYIAGDKIYADNLWIGWHKSFTPEAVYPLFTISTLPHSVNYLQRQDVQNFIWFADNFVYIIKPAPLILGDARYVRDKKPLWAIMLNAKPDHVIWLN